MGQIVRGRDDQNFTDPREHKHTQGIIDHRLIVDRHQLLGRSQGQWIKSSAASAGEDYAFHRTDLTADYAGYTGKIGYDYRRPDVLPRKDRMLVPQYPPRNLRTRQNLWFQFLNLGFGIHPL